jgi:hypothetical protein
MKQRLRKWLIKVLKKWLKKLGGVKRVEWNMDAKQKEYLEQMRIAHESVDNFRNSEEFMKNIEIGKEFPNNLAFYFEHNFRVKLANIPSPLFTAARKTGDNLYEFEFFIAEYNDTNIIDAFKELNWKNTVEEDRLNIEIEVIHASGELFKTIVLDKCRVDEVRYFENLDHYGSELLKGVVTVTFDSINIK